MDVDKFVQQVESTQYRLTAIYQDAITTPVLSPHIMLPTAFKELGCASEQLQIATEKLLQQNQAIATLRATLEKERQRYHKLLDLTPEAYLVTDATGIICEANSVVSKLLNISQKYLLGKPLSAFIHEQEYHKFFRQLQQLLPNDRAQELLIKLIPHQGEPFDASLRIGTEYDEVGKVVRLYICISDITEKLRALKVENTAEYDFMENRPRHFYSKGTRIPLSNHYIWLVCQGFVKLNTLCEDGQDVLVGLAKPQMVFGPSLTSLEPYFATALSKNVELVRISLTEISASPQLAMAVLLKNNKGLQQTESFLAISGQRRLLDRLMHLLLLLKKEIGQLTPQGIQIPVRLTHNDLASACCATRVTVTRLLGKLEQQQMISFDENSYMIVKDEFKTLC